MSAVRDAADRRVDLGPWAAQIAAVAAADAGLLPLGDGELAARAAGLRGRARSGEPEAALLVEAFALVREAARRALGQRPYDVQVAAGIALQQGRIVEMQTGEGKTLAAVAPAFLASLSGRGVHVLTFNDYLARRDAAWMGPAYERLGVRVGHVQESMAPAERRAAYACDVTYVTAKEAGFDLLRDGLCLDRTEQVHRPFHLALVDEADSILIDEARIPLVIAGRVAGGHAGLAELARLARELAPGVDFDSDERGRNVALTEAGSLRAEAALGCGSLFAPERLDLLAALRNALHAEHLLRRDVDYIVRRGAVELVDELTGRVAERRQWRDGLQAAVEAKEGLALGADGRILGSITMQHLVRLYPRLCGMTATAAPAAAELRRVYELEVAVIPTHRPCRRLDLPDLVFTHAAARDAAVLAEVGAAHGAGRPVLVGTVSVAASEALAARLEDAGIPCRVLNAKHDEQEAAVVAEAGAPGAVTISTNMAGRGTDIRLGGRDERERDRVVALGGLLVLGTHLHESARVDRQLRGRAGRQGDPGASRFLVSLDDDLLARHGIRGLLPRSVLDARLEHPIESALVRREVARAQRIAEGEWGDARRRLYEFSDIVERQRAYLAEWRQSVLDGTAEPDLLRTRAAERWSALEPEVGEATLREVERRLTLLAIDHAWSDHLAELQGVRDEVHLVALDGRQPIAEFYRAAMAGFEPLLDRIEDEVISAFATLPISRDGVDWSATALRAPGATWTYLVHDDVYSTNVMRSLANRASIGLWGVLLLWPVLLAWGFYERWRRSRRQREAGG